MVTKDTDITDEEIETIHKPFEDNVMAFMNNYVFPEVLAFQLANSHYRECLCDATLEQHCNSMLDLFTCYNRKDLNKILLPTAVLFEIKYNLMIINVNPLKLEKFK